MTNNVFGGMLNLTQSINQSVRDNDIPHESSIDPHQLLMVHHVGLVEHNTNLVVVTSHAFNDATELVRDVKLVCVKQQNNTVDTLS